MNGRLLIITARYLVPFLAALSLWSLFRGHNAPGGGFIGGLAASVAFGLFLLAEGAEKTKSVLPFDPRSLIGAGLLIALASSLLSVIREDRFFAGQWASITLPGGAEFTFGTPVLFDLGVYLAVLGVLMIILYALLEE